MILVLERAKGVEPSSPAWEAGVMPLYDARVAPGRRGRRRPGSVLYALSCGGLNHCPGCRIGPFLLSCARAAGPCLRPPAL